MKQVKNEFLPKSILQPIQEGEMSIADLSNDISIVNNSAHYGRY